MGSSQRTTLRVRGTAEARVSAVRCLRTASAQTGRCRIAQVQQNHRVEWGGARHGPRAFAADLHGAVEDAAQAKGVAREAVERLDRLVSVRVWRVGYVIHCARRKWRPVSGLRTAYAARGACCSAGHAQQPTFARRAALGAQAQQNQRRRTSGAAATRAHTAPTSGAPAPDSRAVPFHAQRGADAAAGGTTAVLSRPEGANSGLRAAQGLRGASGAPLMETSDMLHPGAVFLVAARRESSHSRPRVARSLCPVRLRTPRASRRRPVDGWRYAC